MIEQRPEWSGRKLAKLGDAIASNTTPATDCPSYADVMNWHSEMASQIVLMVGLHEPWNSYRGALDISGRAKTIDTLRDKLHRESHLRLNQVQDLAGVRVEMDCTLAQQAAFAEEVAQFFSTVGSAEIKDIRTTPHSGYRGVHIWLRLPAGRAEIQIRTRGQSAWANTYERLGDLVGRHIRYGQSHDNPTVQQLVDVMHALSEDLAAAETAQQEAGELATDIANLERSVQQGTESLNTAGPDARRREAMTALGGVVAQMRERLTELAAKAESKLNQYVNGLNYLISILDEEHDPERR